MLKECVFFTYKEIQISVRQASSWLSPLLFFISIIFLFPLAVGPSPLLLNKIGPAVLWVAALLATLISIDQLFREDEEEGVLDLFLLSPCPLALLVSLKILSHWVAHCLPLILVSPLLGFLLKLSPAQEWALIFSLLLGTPVFCLIGAIGVALLIGIRTHGFLVPILILPFYVPVLIYGTSCVMAAGQQRSLGGYFALLGALTLFSLVFSPFLTAAALRIGASE